MPVYLLYTVGNRDLLVEGNPLPSTEQRQKGEQILNDFDSQKDKLSAPQLQATIDYILQQQPKIDELHLFVTDQPKQLGAQYYSDTCFIGDVLRKYLCFRFPTHLLASIKVRRIQNINVAQYDEVYQWFSQNLNLPQAEDNLFYLCPTAGIPAITQGLLLCGTRRFQSRCQVLYLPIEERMPIEVQFPNLFLLDLHKESLKHFLKNYHYAAASKLLKEMSPLNWKMPTISWIEAVIESTMHRLHFDFTTARRLLEDQAIPFTSGEVRVALISIRNQLGSLIKAAERAEKEFDQQAILDLLEELFYNAEITFLNGQYIDFLGRLFRFQEATCRYLVELYLKLPTDALNKRKIFIQGVEQNPNLVQYLKQSNIDYRTMDIPAFLGVVSYLAQEGFEPSEENLILDKEAITNCYELLNRIQKLASWRNKSIIAHSWQGINKEQLLSEYGVNPEEEALAPVEDMKRVLDWLGKPPKENPFEKVNALILPFLNA